MGVGAWLLGVTNAPITQNWMLLHFSPDLFTASVVMLVAIGQLHTGFSSRRLMGCVGLASIKKSAHDVLRESPSPRSLAWAGLRLAKTR